MALPWSPDPAATTDERLWERLSEGDQRAFDRLFERYLPRIYALAARHCGERAERAEIESVVEEAFERLLASLDEPRRVETFAVLALSVTRSALSRRAREPRGS